MDAPASSLATLSAVQHVEQARWLPSPLDVARLDCTSHLFHLGAPSSAVEEGLRLRAQAAGRAVEATAVEATDGGAAPSIQPPPPARLLASGRPVCQTSVAMRTVVICCVRCAVSDLGYACFAPFFPSDALARGVSHGLVGAIFAASPLTEVLLVPLTPGDLRCLGRRCCMRLSRLVIAAATGCFAFTRYLHATHSFLAVSLALRVVQGAGGAFFEPLPSR